ncbi:YpdA family putative bacillithiol disulfide reductase [Myroides sp. LJL116]
MVKNFDIVIVGAGPIGIACALEAKKKGLSYIVLEKGCLVNSLYNYPVNMQFFSSSELLELDNIPFVSIQNKPRRNEALEYYRRVCTNSDLNIQLFTQVTDIKKNSSGDFEIETSKGKYFSINVIIATGFYDFPNLLHIPGENLEKVSHYYKDPHFYASTNVVVIGASNSSVDAALECYRKGANVTMIIRDDKISDTVKYWAKPDIENRIAENSITAYFNSNLTNITPEHVSFEQNGESKTIANDFVLALTGYHPNYDFLRKVGIQIKDQATKEPMYNYDTMETNIDNLYLAGVVCGGINTHKLFIENSRIHAKQILSHIIEEHRYRS